jgi:CelD/BcsL family acetyltransferase involved in cellulose biosynthesis
MARTDDWRFEWRRSWEDVWSGEFVARWRTLLTRATWSHVYHQPELVRAWAETLGARLQCTPQVGIATSSTAEVLLPWVVVSQSGRLTTRRTLEAAGREMFGYHTPLVAGAEPASIDWSGFWDAARGSAAGAYERALFRFIEPGFAGALPLQARSEESPVLPLAGCANLDEVLGRCSSSHRVDVRRQMKHAAGTGPLSLWSAGPADVAEALRSLRQEFWPAYRNLWTGKTAPNALLAPGVDAFLERVVADGVGAGWAHYSVLRAGDTPIGWHLGFLDAGRLYYWIPTYDRAWSKLSPGKLLLAKLIEEGCHAGWREIHLLTGNHEYKLAWNPTPKALVAMTWTASTMRGRVFGLYDDIARARRSRRLHS